MRLDDDKVVESTENEHPEHEMGSIKDPWLNKERPRKRAKEKTQSREPVEDAYEVVMGFVIACE